MLIVRSVLIIIIVVAAISGTIKGGVAMATRDTVKADEKSRTVQEKSNRH